MVNRRKYKIRKTEPNFLPLRQLVNHVEVKEKNYWKDRQVCFLGLKHSYEYYEQLGEFPSLENDLREHIRGFTIDRSEHYNMCVISSAGFGKSKLTRNMMCDFHNQGYGIMVFSPKSDEMESAKKQGTKFRLHPLSNPQTLPIVSYVPSYVKEFLKKNNMWKNKYKTYSHPLSTLGDRSFWQGLSLSPQLSTYVSNKIKKGITNIKDLLKEVDKDKSNLFEGEVRSLKAKISTISDSNFVDERYEGIDLNYHWGFRKEDKALPESQRRNDVVVVNHFSVSNGNFLANDVYLLLDKVRQTVQKARSNGFNRPLLLFLDDAFYYASKNQNHQQCVDMITNVQVNLRKLNVNLIVIFQHPDLLSPHLIRGASSFLFSYMPDFSTVQNLMPQECVQYYKYQMTYEKPYNVEWIYVWAGNQYLPLYPDNVRTGFDFN